MTLSPEARAFFRRELAAGRAMALADAEDFDEILFAVERLGAFLTDPPVRGLGSYKHTLGELAQCSPLESALGAQALGFSQLFALVKGGRNDVMHEGVHARQFVEHAVNLALVLEDALMVGVDEVQHYMARSPLCAELWQPLRLIRQAMLQHSFSAIPVCTEDDDWRLVTDRVLAKALARTDGETRQQRLAMPLAEALRRELFTLPSGVPVSPDTKISEISWGEDEPPLRLVFETGQRRLIGVLTPFDLL